MIKRSEVIENVKENSSTVIKFLGFIKKSPPPIVVRKIKEELEKFEEYMQDDFNTANALSSWYEVVRITNSYTAQNEVNKETLELLKAAFDTYSSILGINVKDDNSLEDSHIEKLIEERENARKNRDFALADKIRDDLKEQGIILEDTKQGVRWKKI